MGVLDEDLLGGWRRTAINEIDTFLVGRDPKCRRLGRTDLPKYGQYEAETGWSTFIEAGDNRFTIDLIADADTPFSPPLIFLAGESKLLCWPHVERDNRVCVLPGHATHVVHATATLVEHLLGEAGRLVAANLAGEINADFVAEFQNYWRLKLSPSASAFWSLLRPEPPSRLVRYTETEGRVLVCDEESSGRRWVENYFRRRQRHAPEFKEAALLWLTAPLDPRDVPKSNADILKLALGRSDDGGLAILEAALDSAPERIPLVIGFATSNGPVLVGLWLPSPSVRSTPRGKAGNPLEDGYRKGRAPANVKMRRFLTAASKAKRAEVVRCDASWLLSRGGSKLSLQLRDKSVAVVGCGSIGGSAAQLLAQAGVGRLALLDPDPLQWENVCRHVLGGSEAIGKNKAEAVSGFLRGRFPFLDVEAYSEKWERTSQDDASPLTTADVVLATTGIWASEAHLNALCRCNLDFPPVVFGWTEAHACAGHALAVLPVGGCLACGFDDKGNFEQAATEWEAEQLEREPACGAFFQPYGSADLAPIVSMIVTTVIDVLLGEVGRSEHRAWLGSTIRLEGLGGHWSRSASRINGSTGQGELVSRETWRRDEKCPLCGAS